MQLCVAPCPHTLLEIALSFPKQVIMLIQGAGGEGRTRVKGLLGAPFSCCDTNWFLVSSLSGYDRRARSLHSPIQLSVHRVAQYHLSPETSTHSFPCWIGQQCLLHIPNCAQCHPLLTPLLTGQDSRTHHSVPRTMCPPGAPAHPGCRCRGSCGSEAGAWSGGCQGSAAPAAPLRSPSCCSHCCRST